jgi:hypothetical protein
MIDFIKNFWHSYHTIILWIVVEIALSYLIGFEFCLWSPTSICPWYGTITIFWTIGADILWFLVGWAKFMDWIDLN